MYSRATPLYRKYRSDDRSAIQEKVRQKATSSRGEAGATLRQELLEASFAFYVRQLIKTAALVPPIEPVSHESSHLGLEISHRSLASEAKISLTSQPAAAIIPLRPARWLPAPVHSASPHDGDNG